MPVETVSRYEPGVKLPGSVAVIMVGLELFTTSVPPFKVTAGVVLPKLFPLIVSTCVVKSARALLMTIWLTEDVCMRGALRAPDAASMDAGAKARNAANKAVRLTNCV